MLQWSLEKNLQEQGFAILYTSPLATERRVSTHVFSYRVIMWNAFKLKYSLDLTWNGTNSCAKSR